MVSSPSVPHFPKKNKESKIKNFKNNQTNLNLIETKLHVKKFIGAQICLFFYMRGKRNLLFFRNRKLL